MRALTDSDKLERHRVMNRIFAAALIVALLLVGCQTAQGDPPDDAVPDIYAGQPDLPSGDERQAEQEWLEEILREREEMLRAQEARDPEPGSPTFVIARLTCEQRQAVYCAVIYTLQRYEDGAIDASDQRFMEIPQWSRIHRLDHLIEILQYEKLGLSGVASVGVYKYGDAGGYVVEMPVAFVSDTDPPRHVSLHMYLWLFESEENPGTFDVHSTAFAPRRLFFTELG